MQSAQHNTNFSNFFAGKKLSCFAIKELEENNCPDFVRDFCLSSRRDGRCIVLLCACRHNVRRRAKRQTKWMIIFFHLSNLPKLFLYYISLIILFKTDSISSCISFSLFSLRASKRSTRAGWVLEALTSPHPSSYNALKPSISMISCFALK